MSASTSVVGRGWDLGHLEHVLRLAAYQDAVVLVGQVRGAALADWGRTLWPLSCSHGRSVGAKGLSGVSAASACSGQVRAQGSSGQADLVVVRVRALDGLVVWVRRTGLKDREEAVASVALDAKADVYVLGSFASQAAGLAQGVGRACEALRDGHERRRAERARERRRREALGGRGAHAGSEPAREDANLEKRANSR